MSCPLCQTLTSAKANPHYLAELGESVVLLGENQGCPGWCVLIAKDHIEHLAEWPRDRQARLFDDVARVAAAVRAAFPGGGAGGGPVRINYECLGNQVAHVHWHVIPRHADDPTPRQAVWGWTPEQLRGGMTATQRVALALQLRERIARV
ncbi:MAG: HIT domain-containing protein [Phycisphaerae bacterium]|nr:HIT domain-containing protein [Phycisphaerae bacterium]